VINRERLGAFPELPDLRLILGPASGLRLNSSSPGPLIDIGAIHSMFISVVLTLDLGIP
jgi:hypothetical protein